MENLKISTPPLIFSGVQIEKNEIGMACSTYGGEESCIQGFGGENLREIDHLENTDIDGRIILCWIFRKWNVGSWTGSIWIIIGAGGGHL